MRASVAINKVLIKCRGESDEGTDITFERYTFSNARRFIEG